MAFEGEFICEAGKIIKDEIGEYRPPCEICDTKYPADQIMRDDDSNLDVCKSCMKSITESALAKPEQ